MDEALRRYKAFIDSLTPLMEQFFKVESLPDLEDPKGEAAKLLLARLNEQERGAVNLLFKHITSAGVYHTLECLDRLAAAGKLALAWEGGELPARPYGEDMATDWLNRCEGDAWPDESACPVHGGRLLVEPVPVVYGLTRHPLEYYRAGRGSFPLANAVIEGSCFVGSDEAQPRPYCDGCRRALAAWAAETGLRDGLPRDAETFLRRYGGPAGPGAAGASEL